MELQRLQKVMASCGVGSRRACEQMISDGRVEVDGEIVTELGTRVDLDVQAVRCDGQRLRPPRLFTYLLNKPRGVICSQAGDPDRPKATDYVPARARDRRLFTIGRLDVDSEGAILLTNDGDLCHKVTHPRFEIPKTYHVEIEGVPDDETVAKMRKGVWLAEGRTGALDIRVVARLRHKTRLEVRLNEGMKREIRRVCARFGHEVLKLRRISIGPIQLGNLAVGAIRELTGEELKALRESAQAVVRLGSARPAKARHRTRARRGDS